jgi:DnaJ-class molecular chaperone
VKDYYKILEVSPEASQEDIQQQWRFFVQAWHPDKFAHPEHKRRAEEKFKEINEAYTILRHPHKRQAYNVQRTQAAHRRQAEAARQHEAFRKQAEVAHRVKREQRHGAHVNAAQRRAKTAQQRAAQATTGPHALSPRVLFLLFIFLCIGLLVWLST